MGPDIFNGIPPVLGRRDSGMLLEIFAEKRLVREIQRFGHLQDRQSGRFQQGLGFENHIIVDPRAGRFSGKSLNHV